MMRRIFVRATVIQLASEEYDSGFIVHTFESFESIYIIDLVTSECLYIVRPSAPG